MPDGTLPSSSDAVATALAAARVSLEEQLASHPDWAAWTALAGAKCADPTQVAALEQRLSVVPAFKALQQLQTAAALLPTRLTIYAVKPAQPPKIQPAEHIVVIAEPVRADQMPTPTDWRDDLTRIRGIDEILAQRLAGIGIHRFAQIAAWKIEDVRTIAQAMGLSRSFIRSGVIEQAAMLEEERLARGIAHLQPVTAAQPLQTTEIATWAPRTVHGDPLPDRVVSPADRAHAIARIRQGLPMNRIVPLSAVAPEIATTVYVRADLAHSAPELRWGSAPLVPLIEPDVPLQPVAHAPHPQARTIVHADPTDVLFRQSIAARAALVERPAEQADVEAPASAVASDAANAFEPPLHERARQTLDNLEAEIEIMTSAPRDLAPDAVVVALNTTTSVQSAPDGHVISVAMTSDDAAIDYGALADVGEADVEIVVGQARKPVLAPLPALPLTERKQTAPRADADANILTFDAVQGFVPVEEAAVIIVRRDTAESPVAGLAFYAQATQQNPGPVRRFLRALSGS